MRIDFKNEEESTDRRVIGRRGFLTLAGAVIGLTGLRSLFKGEPAAAPKHADDRRTNNVSDVTARWWVGGDRLAG